MGNSVIALSSYDPIAGIAIDPSLVGGGGTGLNPSASASPPYAEIWNLHNVASGVTGVTFAVDSAVRASMQLAEFSGVADAAATDTDTNSATSATASVAGLSGDGLGVVIFAVANATNPFNEGTLTAGWTSLGVTGGNGVWQMSAYKIDAIGAVSVTLTGSLDWAGAGSVFAAA